MKKVKFLLAAIICMLLSVSVLAQNDETCCTSTTEVIVDVSQGPGKPFVGIVTVEWWLQGGKAWQETQTWPYTPGIKPHLFFTASYCKWEIAGMKITVLRTNAGIPQQPVIQIYKGYIPKSIIFVP